MTQRTLYYAGYDPGSGIGSLVLTRIDERGHPAETRTLSLASLIGAADFARLRNDRGLRTDVSLASVLRQGEIALGYNGKEYYVADLAELEGVNTTSAKGASKRYTDLHSRLLLLGLCGALIPEREADLRLVSGIPISLFEPKIRREVKANLEGQHPFTYNGRPRVVNVSVGTITREGAKTLATYGLEKGRQGFLDIGERTTDIGQANGQTILSRYCRCETYGVGKVLDTLIAYSRTKHRRALTLSDARETLKAYTASRPLPPIKVGGVPLSEGEVRAVIDDAVESEGNAIETFIAQVWNEEGTDVGSNLELIVLVGGGAKVWGRRLRALFPQIVVPDETEDAPLLANVEAYHHLAFDLEEIDPAVWKS